MAVYMLDDRLLFPPADEAEPGGLLAVGGDLSPERLILAYSEGIFPWYAEGQPVLWHSPDPRMVLTAERLHVSRSLRRRLRQQTYEVRLDSAFDAVITACAQVPRPDQEGTWITPEMREAYLRLHDAGLAHSAEAWCDGRLVGGMYGVSLGGVFFGESMFTEHPDASKVALVTLVRTMASWGIDLLDCQVHTDNLARFGAELWPRGDFLQALRERLERPTRQGPWRLTGDL